MSLAVLAGLKRAERPCDMRRDNRAGRRATAFPELSTEPVDGLCINQWTSAAICG
jgi:hypothetical protein